MYILKTSYTWNPTGDRYEQKVIFDLEKDADYELFKVLEAADSILENECIDEYEIELIYTKTVFKTSVRREDL